MSEPKVYMACLASYNNGLLRGAWRSADDLERGWRHPNDWKAGFGGEEWAIHDYDGVPSIGEHPDIEFLIEVMRGIEEHGDAFFHWFNDDSWNMSHLKGELEDHFREQYRGEYDSPKAFAEEYAIEVGWLSDPLTHDNPLFRYIDFDWYWRSTLRHSFTYSNGHVWCCE